MKSIMEQLREQPIVDAQFRDILAGKPVSPAIDEFAIGEAQRLREVNVELVKAADRVCWFDWSDNDADAVQAIDALRAAIARAEGTK